jgi:DNA ligase-1
LDEFASAAGAAAATTKKLEKRSILAAYLRGLDAEALPIAAVFLTGRPFPLSSERTVNVGGALLRDAACALTDIPPEAFDAAYVPLGDVGETVAAVLADRAHPLASLTLIEAGKVCDALARTPKPTDRAEVLRAALAACRPAAAAFLVKALTGDLRIGVQESLVEEALAGAFGRDIAAVRRANMLLGDIGRTALLAREDRLHEARLMLFRPLKFMLASPVDEAEDALRIAGNWVVEDKFDGIRCQLHTDGQTTRLYSRTLDPVTEQFPEIVEAFAGYGRQVVLDGELLARDGDRQLGFGALSRRVGRKRLSPALRAEVPVVFVAFDLLAVDGAPCLEEPLTARREALASLPGVARLEVPVLQPVASADEIAGAFEAALARGNEGLMLKSPGSTYQPGKRGRAWLKLKRPLATLDAVIIAAEYGHGNRRGLLSDYTFAVRDGDRLATVGKSYSGVTDQEIAALTDLFRRTALRDFGNGVIVPPTVVVEVAFNGINRSARHQAGFALRFPRIKRLRPDKPVAEIDTLDRVRELWAHQETPRE